MTTNLDLDAIEARAAAATPGPWAFAKDDALRHRLTLSDEVFCAAARTDVPALCAAVRERDAEIARLREVLSYYADTGEVGSYWRDSGLWRKAHAALASAPAPSSSEGET